MESKLRQRRHREAGDAAWAADAAADAAWDAAWAAAREARKAAGDETYEFTSDEASRIAAAIRARGEK